MVVSQSGSSHKPSFSIQVTHSRLLAGPSGNWSINLCRASASGSGVAPCSKSVRLPSGSGAEVGTTTPIGRSCACAKRAVCIDPPLAGVWATMIPADTPLCSRFRRMNRWTLGRHAGRMLANERAATGEKARREVLRARADGPGQVRGPQGRGYALPPAGSRGARLHRTPAPAH